MNEFVLKDGRKLRLGYTTGSCAAAASAGAARMLLSGKPIESVVLDTPKGIRLELALEDIGFGEGSVSCAVRKDSGDDPDVTNGALIYSEVSFSEDEGVSIDGGFGIGRVTKRGLDRAVGEAAINSVPREMITKNVLEAAKLFDHTGGFRVVISCPEGEALAAKTFNPRLGIIGGISILGTSGIVEPMSEKALVDTIRLELTQRRALGARSVLLTPGNYGADHIRNSLGIDPGTAVQTSNFIGDSIDICRELGFRRAVLVGHIGKLVKLAGGMMNTHSKYGDCRMEIIAAHAGKEGAGSGLVGRILGCVACDEAIRLLREEDESLCGRTLASLAERIGANLRARAGDGLAIEALFFSKEYGNLGWTPGAFEALKGFTED